MIDLKEMRLGNWVNCANVMEGGKLYPNQFTGWNDYLDIEAYGEPMRLTEDILIKCGFEINTWNNGNTSGAEFTKDVNDFKLQFGWFVSAKSWTEFKIIGNGCYDEAGEMLINDTCKYLHQLQNLYYALTGTELIINL